MSTFGLIRNGWWVGCVCVAMAATAPADEVVLVAGGGQGPDGGPAISAAMGQPFGCAIDAAGNLFVADASEHRVRKVDPRGVITTVGGTGRDR